MYTTAVLGVLGDRIPRALRRIGADGGGVHLLRQRAPAGRAQRSRRGPRGGALPAPADHDDRAGGGARPPPGGALDRRGVGFPEAVRAGDRGRALLPAPDQRVSDAGALRRRGAGRGPAGGVMHRIRIRLAALLLLATTLAGGPGLAGLEAYQHAHRTTPGHGFRTHFERRGGADHDDACRIWLLSAPARTPPPPQRAVRLPRPLSGGRGGAPPADPCRIWPLAPRARPPPPPEGAPPLPRPVAVTPAVAV